MSAQKCGCTGKKKRLSICVWIYFGARVFTGPYDSYLLKREIRRLFWCARTYHSRPCRFFVCTAIVSKSKLRFGRSRNCWELSDIISGACTCSCCFYAGSHPISTPGRFRILSLRPANPQFRLHFCALDASSAVHFHSASWHTPDE